MMKLLIALLPNKNVLLQISQDDKAIAHFEMDADAAEGVAKQIADCVALARAGDQKPRQH